MSQSELACVYAALILHDDGVDISVHSSLIENGQSFANRKELMRSFDASPGRLLK